MAQGPGSEPQEDNSPDLNMVAVFRSDNFDGEMEAMAVHSLLQANGIESVVAGPSVLPVVEFQVQVAQADQAAAAKIIADAEAAGPEAAAEAEAESEKGN